MHQVEQELPADSVTEEAVTWFLRIRDGFSQSDFREWRRWLAADDSHAEAFDAVREFWQDADQLDDLPYPDEDNLAADTYDGDSPLPLPAVSEQKSHHSVRARYWLAAAASIAAVSLIGFGLLRELDQDAVDYQTNTGEHQSIALDDGSSITLGADSDVRVAYDRGTRRIELRRGEAYFKVAKDPNRPFIVAAGARTVRALGTEFDVNIGVRGIRVAVIEGEVSVAGPPLRNPSAAGTTELETALRLGTGDVLDFNAAGRIGIVSKVDPMLSTSWLSGRLAYDGARLESVIADVNRYSQTELFIGDDKTKQLIFTGTIFSDDIENWLAGLERVFPLRLVNVDGHGVVLIHAER